MTWETATQPLSGICITPAILCWRGPGSQWQRNFHLKAVRPLVDVFSTASDRCSNADPRWLNKLKPTQNGLHFDDYIFKLVFLYDNFVFKLHWKLFPKVRLTYVSTSSGNGLVPQAINHYLNQWWPSLLTHMCVSSKLDVIRQSLGMRHELQMLPPVWLADCYIDWGTPNLQWIMGQL